MQPKISIIIPMYNVEKYIRRCLDSVLNQTFTDWQAICVDDGTPDKSGDIAEEYAKHDPRFIVLHKTTNNGVSTARNIAIKQATGEYIMYLDSDDCIHPQTMEICYTLAKQENVSIVTYHYNRQQQSIETKTNFPPNQNPNFFQEKYNINNIKYKKTNNLITMATNHNKGPNSYYSQQGFVTHALIKHELIQDLTFPTDLHVLEDFIYWAEILYREPSAVLTKLQLYSYTVNNNSLLHTNHGIHSTINIIKGINDCAQMYMKHPHRHTANLWYKRFMWSILSRIYKSCRTFINTPNTSIEQKQLILNSLINLNKSGILNLTPNWHAYRYSKRIKKLLTYNK